jgi:hypothetical protein
VVALSGVRKQGLPIDGCVDDQREDTYVPIGGNDDRGIPPDEYISPGVRLGQHVRSLEVKSSAGCRGGR